MTIAKRTDTELLRNHRVSQEMLRWYDRSARALPWRVSPTDQKRGTRPHAYHIWLSEIMLQQTTVATVTPYFQKFIKLWPTVEALAAADRENVLAAWAGLGYYARARNLHKCAQLIVTDYQGVFPQTETELRDLPGIGAYTAAAIATIAFDQPATVIDGNIERVIARLMHIDTPLPSAKPEIRRNAEALTPTDRAGDYAQAMMDLGATICTPRTPNCGVCPIANNCLAMRYGVQASLPVKTPKKSQPIRYGVAFIAVDRRRFVYLHRRPDDGLLGGMLGLPGSDWTEKPPAWRDAVPFDAAWRRFALEARHSFTHFHLRLDLIGATLEKRPKSLRGEWVSASAIGEREIPTLYIKALQIGLPSILNQGC